VITSLTVSGLGQSAPAWAEYTIELLALLALAAALALMSWDDRRRGPRR
jgi:hypothetical protein